MFAASTSRSRLTTIAQAAAPLLTIAFVAALLLHFPPTQYSFYPRCPFHEAFGLLCPGCGATRALAALLHGDLHGALQLNAFAVGLLPVAAVYGMAFYTRFLRQPTMRLPQPPAPAIYATLVAAFVFTVARNL